MPAELTIIGENHIRRLVRGELSPDDALAVQEVIATDPAARRYFEVLLETSDRDQAEYPINDSECRRFDRIPVANGAALRSSLIVIAFLIAALSIDANHFHLWIGSLQSAVAGQLSAVL